LTPLDGVSIIQEAENLLKQAKESLDRALEMAVSRALRDNLAPLQRTSDELHQAYADFVAACSSSRPSNALPAMLRAQTAAAALAAGLNVLSNFVTVALNQHDLAASVEQIRASSATVLELEEPPVARSEEVPAETSEPRDVAYDLEADISAGFEQPVPEAVVEEPGPVEQPSVPGDFEAPVHAETVAADPHVHVMQQETPIRESPASHPYPVEHPVVEAPEAQLPASHVQVVEPPAFDVAGFIASLPTEQQDLHRRANRVAKVTMQDIKLLKPGDVQNGREHKDICIRLRSELDKARREYDRRFRTILDHPVDYFHYWLVEILAEGRGEALGEYPYPSPVLRR
jgi:hypothetical protein